MSLANEAMDAGLSAGVAIGLNGGANASVIATGSTQTNGTYITTSNVIVGSADGTKGVTLPSAMPGDSVVVFNNSGSTLKVYPPVGSAIGVNGTGLGSANAAFSHLTYKWAEYFCFSSTQWFVIVSA